MDRATALTKIEPAKHALADVLAGEGFPWEIIPMLVQIAQTLYEWFKRYPKMAAGQTCPSEVAAQATQLRETLGEAFAQAVCHECCCNHDH